MHLMTTSFYEDLEENLINAFNHLGVFNWSLNVFNAYDFLGRPCGRFQESLMNVFHLLGVVNWAINTFNAYLFLGRL